MKNLKERLNPSVLFLLGFLVLAALVTFGGRFIEHAPNFTPMGALALFVGVYVASKTKWALLFPLAVLFVSDLFIGFYDPGVMAAVYGSFLLYAVLGLAIAKRKNFANVLAGSFTGAVLFFVITNAAVWYFSSLYPNTLAGLMLSYEMALPFFRWTLLGDAIFVSLFFGAYEFALATYGKKVEAKQLKTSS